MKDPVVRLNVKLNVVIAAQMAVIVMLVLLCYAKCGDIWGRGGCRCTGPTRVTVTNASVEPVHLGIWETRE